MITPGSFDLITAREITGDSLARNIEGKARQDADVEGYDPPKVDGEFYWQKVERQMQAIVYHEQYKKRLERNNRKLAL